MPHRSAAGLGDGVPTSGEQDTAEATVPVGAGSGQGIRGSRQTESHKQGHAEEG